MPNGTSTADLLLSVRSRLNAQSHSVEDVLSALQDRGIAAALLVLTIPLLLPIPLGVSNILAIPVVAVAAQMALGRTEPWLPKRIRARSIDRAHLHKACLRAETPLRWLERFVRPRLSMLCDRRGRRLTGVACLIISLICLVPLPLTGWLPAWALATIGVGMLEHDGLVVLAGSLLGVGALIVLALVLLGLVEVAT